MIVAHYILHFGKGSSYLVMWQTVLRPTCGVYYLRFLLTFSSGSCVSEGLLSSDGRESNCSCMYIHIYVHITTINIERLGMR